MTKLQEKREYYSDRSLKSIYYVDEQGRKQGAVTVFEQNSDKVIKKENYKDGILHGEVEDVKSGTKSVYENGELTSVTKNHISFTETEKYENGKVVERIHASPYWLHKYDGHGKMTYNKDSTGEMRYVEGKPYEGYYKYEFTIGEQAGVEAVGEESFVVKDGKIVGDYHYEKKSKPNGDTYTYYPEKADWKNVEKYYASFEDGKPVGEYKMLAKASHIPDIVRLGYGVDEKLSDSYIVEGSFIAGKFTGKAYSKYNPDNNNFVFEGGVLMSEFHYNDGVTKNMDYPDKYYKKTRNNDGTYTVEEKHDTNSECNKFSHEKWTEKDGKREGSYQKINVKGWVEVEAQYKDGQLHGEYKELNSDGTVYSTKYYENGKDVTVVHLAKEKIAERRKQANIEDRPLLKKIADSKVFNDIALKCAIMDVKQSQK